MRNAKSRIRLSVTLALVLVIMVSLLAVELLANIAKRNMEKQSISVADISSRFLCAVASSTLSSGEWVMHSSLSQLAYIRNVAWVKNDGTSYYDSITIYHHVIDDEDLQTLTKDDVFNMLHAFLQYNESYRSAIMAFEPGVTGIAGERGFAAHIQLNDTTRSDLVSEGYNVFGSELYRELCSYEGNTLFKFQTILDSVQVLTMATKLYDSRDRMVGHFIVDIPPLYISTVLDKFRLSGDIGVMIIDSVGTVIASANPEMNGKTLDGISREYEQLDVDGQWVEGVQKLQWQNTPAMVYVPDNSTGSKNITYVRKLKAVKYRLVVIKSGDEVFQLLGGFRLALWGITITSLLLVSICALHISRLYRRKSRLNNLMSGELKAAGVIQAGILPPNPGVEGKGRTINLPIGTDVYGMQKQAIVVGGDMYDYVLKDERLYFVIGDVSGKGVPAAMVMAQISSLIRYIISLQNTPDEILVALNNAVMERSDDSVLCTMIVGVLNTVTGQLLLSNAGHTRPLVVPATEQPHYLKLRAGMPVYGFVNYPYKTESFVMAPGDRLLLYTDGVTEARSESGEFFGEQRTLKAAQSVDSGKASALVDTVMNRIELFTGNAVQHDDITMLCIEYSGAKTESLHFDSVRDNVTGIVNEILLLTGRPSDLRLRLAVEEPIQNIADYAYRDRGGDGPLDVVVHTGSDSSERRILITLKDAGVHFNPLDIAAPDFSLPLEQRQTGGLGIHFTRSIMESLDYEYTDGKNILHLTYLAENED